MTADDERQAKQLGNQIALMLAGHRTEVAWSAMTGLLGGMIAHLSGLDRGMAHELRAGLDRDLATTLDKNWDWYRAHPPTALGGGGSA